VKSRIPRGSAGVTLIELIIVLVIIGILIGLAAPAMGAMVNRNRLDGAVAQFTTDVAYARMVAVRTNRQVEIVMQPTSYTVQRVELNGQKTQIKRLNLATEYPGMSMSTNLALPATLTFNSRGLLQSGTVNTVTVQQNSRSASVQLLSTGRVYLVY
jgi:prepilin-type N-terminal cleavage/methylation domain-containing protein